MQLLRIAALSALLAGLLTPLAPALQDAGRGSLQDLLRRERERAAQLTTALREQVQVEIQALDNLVGRNVEREVDRRRKALLGLGPAAAPLLVPSLEPGKDAEPAILRRATVVAEVLIRMATPAITDDLLVATQRGSLTSRRLALQVLSHSPEPDRVAPAIQAIYQRSVGPLRTYALESLSRLGGSEAARLVNEALQEDDVELAAVALEALAATRNEEAGPRVLELAASERGEALVGPMLEYFRALPDILDDDDAVAVMLRLASKPGTGMTNRIRILDHLRERDDLKLGRDGKKLAEDLSDALKRDLADATLAMLAKHGDRKARRKLLGPLDDRVDSQPDWPSSYADRGAMLERIGDWDDAVDDYRDALRFARAGRPDADVYRGIVRCLARMKKYKDAAEYLRRSPLSTSERQALAADPAFPAMLQSKYAEVFRLPEDSPLLKQ